MFSNSSSFLYPSLHSLSKRLCLGTTHLYSRDLAHVLWAPSLNLKACLICFAYCNTIAHSWNAVDLIAYWALMIYQVRRCDSNSEFWRSAPGQVNCQILACLLDCFVCIYDRRASSCNFQSLQLYRPPWVCAFASLLIWVSSFILRRQSFWITSATVHAAFCTSKLLELAVTFQSRLLTFRSEVWFVPYVNFMRACRCRADYKSYCSRWYLVSSGVFWRFVAVFALYLCFSNSLTSFGSSLILERV